MTLDEINEKAQSFHLTVLGGFHEENTTTLLLGPAAEFWDFVANHAQFHGPDPLDHWSGWAVHALARSMSAEPFLPYDGPPYHPFIEWSLRSGEAWKSPIGLLVHKDAGLLVSYRGALRFAGRIDLPAPAVSPCEACTDRPCLSACPVDALTPDGYDVPLCKDHIDTDPICRAGCRVRLACPVSQSYARDPAQTAFHMEAFHPS